MRFFNRSFYSERQPSPSGSKEIPEYTLELTSEGVEKLVVCGFRPIYEIIQSSREGACISSIIARWRAGDTSVLQQSAGVYGDFTNIPDNLAECHRAIIKAQNVFNSLPLSERERYNMNLNTFLAEAFNPMNHQTNVPVDPVSPAVSSPPESITIDGRTYNIKKEGASNE